MKKKKLAIIHYSCPPVIGGVEFIIEAHARLFAEEGYPVKMIVGKGGDICAGVETVEIPEIGSSGGPFGDDLVILADGKVPPSFDLAVEQTKKRLADALADVDVCMMHNVLTMHFNLVLTAALAQLIEEKELRTRFIAWTHDSTFCDENYSAHQRNDYPWSLLARKLDQCSYCVISQQRRDELSDLFNVPASDLPVIPDGIDVPRFYGLTPVIKGLFLEEALYRPHVVALTPTRIVRRKNLEAGIEIVAGLKKRGMPIKWLITGAPDPHNADAMEYFSRLTGMRERLDVEKEVIFLCERIDGRISNEDLHGLFAISDILLFPSKREGFGIPAVEGGLAGLLLVLNDIRALREIASDNAVFIRKEQSPADVAGEIIDAFENSPQLRFKRNMIEKYSWHSIFEDKIRLAVEQPDVFWGSPL